MYIDWKMFMYVMAIWNISLIFVIIYDHLVHFVFIWYIFPVLVSRTKKSGNPGNYYKIDRPLQQFLFSWGQCYDNYFLLIRTNLIMFSSYIHTYL
jgi:hypothetical protein